ncbi:MAG TPA: MXAN_5187 C-terminal domain-containing protein [Polyangia bacterium]
MASESQTRDGQQLSSEETEAILNDLEQRIDRLKILYEQYFMGIEKLEPQVPRKEVTRIINNLTKSQIRNTGLRFRYRTLVQRWNLYITRWNRILREIENGTYERDVLRAQRNMAKRGVEFPAAELGVKPKRKRPGDVEEEEIAGDGVPAADGAAAPAPAAAPPAPPEPEEEALVMEADLPDEGVLGDEPTKPVLAPSPPPRPPAVARSAPPPAGVPPAARPPTPPAGVAPAARPPTPRAGVAAARPGGATPGGVPAARPPAPGAIAGGMSLDQVQTLFRRLVHAKRLCGENTDGLKLESLVATINKQAPKIMAEHGCRQVEFTVAIKGDKPILKAVPKK